MNGKVTTGMVVGPRIKNGKVSAANRQLVLLDGEELKHKKKISGSWRGIENSKKFVSGRTPRFNDNS